MDTIKLIDIANPKKTKDTINNIIEAYNRVVAHTDTYVFEQAVPSAIWEIQHNLDKLPSVTIIDSAGDQVLADVKYVNTNKVIIQFSSAFSGKAYLN